VGLLGLGGERGTGYFELLGVSYLYELLVYKYLVFGRKLVEKFYIWEFLLLGYDGQNKNE